MTTDGLKRENGIGRYRLPAMAIAHIRSSDDNIQTVDEHLLGVAELSRCSAEKLHLGLAAELAGLVHDFGKYSQQFQVYLLSATGKLNQDVDDDYVEFEKFRGKIDHSTAGAQLVWNSMLPKGKLHQITAQMLSLCVASHHSGLIDCVNASEPNFGANRLLERMSKHDESTHLTEATEAASATLLTQISTSIENDDLYTQVQNAIAKVVGHSKAAGPTVLQTQTGLLVRFLFSCLIDADRVDTADFENPKAADTRQRSEYVEWCVLIERLERKLAEFKPNFEIDTTRNEVAEKCLKKSQSDRGIFSLNVPTGGGKTFASLRFALHHADKNTLDRVFYVIPYTSIIDQNAKVARKVLEMKDEAIVLEHHSNLTPKRQGFREKILTENWDSPVVFTTMVQFLESLFGSGTRGARRMHQLANSVIIFDEIQSLPIKCVHLFNNAVNFLIEQCQSSVLLCTATQPLLHTVDAKKGALKLAPENEIVADVPKLYQELKRTRVINRCKSEGWQDRDIGGLTIELTKESGSCLVVVNTKKSARSIYERLLDQLNKQDGILVYHLSTNMCPAHRKLVLYIVKRLLSSEKPVICVSTQLIEAGVDIDFGSAIRFLAGLDSIAQTAGRCNRNGRVPTGKVFIVNPADENLKLLPEIQIGVETTKRVLQDFTDDPAKYDNDLIGPKAMKWYFENYFYKRAEEMDYPVPASQIGHDDTILNMLSQNTFAVAEFAQSKKEDEDFPFLRQAFMTAARAFEVIDAPTRGVIVPYRRKGKELVRKIMAAEHDFQRRPLLRRAQQFTVNVFPFMLKILKDLNAVYQVDPNLEIFFLDSQYYENEFGLADEPVSPMEFLNA